MPRIARLALALAALLPVAALGQDRPDLILGDFEGESYHPWVADGHAFGPGPARGTLPGQMAVEGFEGSGLASSFRGGDDSTGTLISPPFRVERRFVNFLIGGGKYPGETCLELVVDGRVARSATGPNDSPGGSERLDWASWDVLEFAGRSAVLRVVDRRKGGWGHLSVDQVVQSDRPRGMVAIARELVADRRFLLLPVAPQGPTRRVKVAVDGRVAREFDIKLAEGTPSFASFLDLAAERGKRVEIRADLPIGSRALARIAPADDPVDPGTIYREGRRPRFHFTSRRGWLNDPNGLVYFEGEYHLFYQHNPYGWEWGNMHWGHAVSPDLVRWEELPIAIYPRGYGDWAFSGSAVVDRSNTSGFGSATAPPLVGAYTSTGRGECIVFSLDRGRTWSEYAGNPVVKHEGRDPRLLWHAPTRRWVMALYDETAGRRDVTFHSSPDFKRWTFESRIGGFYECPDLFELPVEGTPGRSSWVLSAADGAYLLGQFDGKTFMPDPGGKRATWHGDFYAAQTFSDEPKGRRVQVGWGRDIAFPGEPFNQQMTAPCELTLRPTADGVRLFANPVAELESLRTRREARSDVAIGPGEVLALAPDGDLLDIRLVAEVGDSGRFSLAARGVAVEYDAARKALTCGGVAAPLGPVDGSIRLRVLVDRGSVEVFGNDGRVAISRGVGAGRGPVDRASASLSGQGVRFPSIVVDELASAWR